MREIFFDEKLGETQRNSEGARAARAGMGVVEGMGGWGGSGENKKSEPFWGLTLYSNNEKRLNFF